MISIEKVREILLTLPIGYYLGRKIELQLVNSDTSYYDAFNDLITIGFKQLPCSRVDYEVNDDEVENDIRCMLYHEISHVIATPNYLYEFILDNWRIGAELKGSDYYESFIKIDDDTRKDFMNIFEDQRIETILGTLFLRVDFPAYVKKVNGYDGPVIAKTPMEAFYNIVRFNDGNPEYIKRVYEIIKKYVAIKNDYAITKNYVVEVVKLYIDIAKEFESEAGETKGDPTEVKLEQPVAISGTPKDDSSESEEEVKALVKKIINELKDEIKTEVIENKKQITDINSISTYKNNNLENKISDIIMNAKRKKGMTASSHVSHLGKVNPKLIGKKYIEDYRWFEKNMDGSKNGSSKLQINVFVDVSGSFSSSEEKINQLLYALNNLQKKNKDFECKLITMGDENILHNKIEPVHCIYGNYLKNEMIDIYKKCQNKNNTIYNIVVFDGDAQSFDSESSLRKRQLRETHKKAWTAWNHPNCVIISDYSNQDNLDKGSPNAKRIYTGNYVDELEANIIKALQMLFK